jgi:hypothetical protein
MLRRVNAALFDAPEGATVQVVAQATGNNGVEAARFEYAGLILNPEQILGLPGCTFTVESDRELLEAGVIFDGAAPGTAQYDLLEVESGVTTPLGKFVLKSDGSSLINFTIRPVPALVPAGVGAGTGGGRAGRPVPRKAAKKAAKKAPKKAAKKAPKKAARKVAKKAARKVAKKAAKKAPKKVAKMGAKKVAKKGAKKTAKRRGTGRSRKGAGK